MSIEAQCGDEVVLDGVRIRCQRPHGHPVVNFNDPKSRKYSFHCNEAWVWDDRNAWKQGEEPGQ